MADGQDVSRQDRQGNGAATGGIGRRRVLAGAGVMALTGALPASAQMLRPKLRPDLAPGLVPELRPGSVTEQVAKVNAPGLQSILDELPKGATCGAVVIDAASGKVLEGHDDEVRLPAGSVQKTITSLYALDKLGAGRQFTTRVMATGPVVGGVLTGDLWLVGGGDPTLDTDSLGELAARLKSSGLKKVTGGFYYDSSRLPTIHRIAADQPIDAAYNPGLSGLLLNFGRVNFQWSRDARKLSMRAQGIRYEAQSHESTMAAVNRNSPIFERAYDSGIEAWTVARFAVMGGGSRWLPVHHAAPFVADIFRTLCAQQGIALPKGQDRAVPAGAVELASGQSSKLTRILRGMLKYSTNVTAETLGLQSSGKDSLLASGAAMQAWAKASLGFDATFHDHSGMSAAARLSPLGLAEALRNGTARASGAVLPSLLNKVALRDSHQRAMVHSGATVHVKTGTLNFVSALTGFIQAPNGRKMIFAIQCADLAKHNKVNAAASEDPPGLRWWLGRARYTQANLLRRWAEVYGGVA